MPELPAAFDAFLQEHRRWGELDAGMADDGVWVTRTCGARIEQPTQTR